MKKLVVAGLLAGFSAFASDSDLTEKLKEIIEGKHNNSMFLLQHYHELLQQEGLGIDNLLSRPIQINVRDVDFSVLFSAISENSGVPIVFKDVDAQRDLKKVSYVSVNKPLKYVLDELTGLQDLFWEYKDGKVEIYKYRSATFKLNLPLLMKNVNLQKDELTLMFQKDIWNKVEESLKGLLKDQGSKLTVSEAGYVFVWARPSELNMITSAVERINRDFSRTIPLRVEVSITKDEDIKQLGIGFNTREGPVSGGLQSGIQSPIFTLSVITQKLEADIKALAKSGKLKLLDESLLVALNGQPVYYAPLTTTRIVSGYDTNFVGVGVATTPQQQAAPVVPTVRVRTEDIKEGATLLMVPYYINDTDIVVEVFREDSRLEKLEKQQIQLPNTQATNFLALPQLSTRRSLTQTVLKPGQKLLLVSSAMTSDQLTDSGIPFLKDIPLLGYLFSTKEKTRDLYRVFITITYEGEVAQ